MFEAFAFYFFSVVVLASFTITVTAKNPLHSMSSLAVGMIMISGYFFLLNADFLGVVQIIVYSGAVMAIYGFGMMFFDTIRDVKEANPSARLVFFLSGMSALLVVVIIATPLISDPMTVEGMKAFHPMMSETFSVAGETYTEAVQNAETVGMVLFTKYLVPFEVAAIMLLVAMIAGIILAGKKMDDSITTMSEDEIKEKELA
jgi:NADH-quinone oxidoreductase subunit J